MKNLFNDILAILIGTSIFFASIVAEFNFIYTILGMIFGLFGVILGIKGIIDTKGDKK